MSLNLEKNTIILLCLQGILSPHSLPVWGKQAQTMISFENYCLCLSLTAHRSGREACCSFLALDLWSKRLQLLIQQAKWEAQGSWWQFKRWQRSRLHLAQSGPSFQILYNIINMNIPAVDMIRIGGSSIGAQGARAHPRPPPPFLAGHIDMNYCSIVQEYFGLSSVE